MSGEDNFLTKIIVISKNISRVFIVIITLMLVLGALHFIVLEFKKLSLPHIYFLMFPVY